MPEEMTEWQKYENDLFEEVVSKYHDSTVLKNVHLMGSLSRAKRQIDILLTETIQGKEVRTAIEAKHYGRSIDVKGVETFIEFDRNVDGNSRC